MLMELLFRQKPAGTGKASVLLFIDSRFINDSDEFGKMFVARIALAHDFKKTNKNVTEQLTSNRVLAQIFLTLWTLSPGATSLCCAFWITLHAIHACIRKHNILQFIY